MPAVKRPAFLIVPAYLLGIAGIYAAAHLLPVPPGIWVAVVLGLILITPLSLVHRTLDYHPGLNIIWYLFVLFISIGFAGSVIPTEFGPMLAPDVSWLQIAFLVVQQVLYLGIHAFLSEYV